MSRPVTSWLWVPRPQARSPISPPLHTQPGEAGPLALRLDAAGVCVSHDAKVILQDKHPGN